MTFEYIINLLIDNMRVHKASKNKDERQQLCESTNHSPPIKFNFGMAESLHLVGYMLIRRQNAMLYTFMKINCE